MDGTDDPFGILTQGAPPRVWSLLVTVFGELAQDEGSHVRGEVLSRICALVGIRPEAMRVALHRLRKEGWIESRRSGRTTAYALTRKGREESQAASPRIYATGEPASRAFLAVFDPGRHAPHVPGGIWVASNLVVTTERPPASDAASLPLGPGRGSLPGWLSDRLFDPLVTAQSRDLERDLIDLDRALGACGALAPIQTAVLRTLVVHSWRRIVLRAPALPDAVFPSDWRGAECRRRVAAFLAAHPRPGLADLEERPDRTSPSPPDRG